MAKKPKETTSEGIPPELASKADAVRAALSEGIDKPIDGVAFVKERYGLDITAQVFSSYKTAEKKKAGTSSAVNMSNGRSRKGDNPFAVAHEVKALIAKYGADHVKAAVALFE